MSYKIKNTTTTKTNKGFSQVSEVEFSDNNYYVAMNDGKTSFAISKEDYEKIQSGIMSGLKLQGIELKTKQENNKWVTRTIRTENILSVYKSEKEEPIIIKDVFDLDKSTEIFNKINKLLEVFIEEFLVGQQFDKANECIETINFMLKTFVFTNLIEDYNHLKFSFEEKCISYFAKTKYDKSYVENIIHINN